MVLVMGVLNVTPDSFSDGGEWFEADRAVAHGRRLIAEGADIVDVGGESTRPGARPVAEDEELRRVIPVIEALAGEVRLSVDTRKATVARAAVGAGAKPINDVSAELWPVAAEPGAGWVAMHMPADPSVMQDHAKYDDVMAEVRAHLVWRAERAAEGGVGEIWIDPGIGFGKTPEHNLVLLRDLDSLVATGWPVVVGTSRKSFLGKLCPAADGSSAPVSDRLEASVASAVWAMTRGAAMVRVHDVRPTAQAACLYSSEHRNRLEEPSRAPTGPDLRSRSAGRQRHEGQMGQRHPAAVFRVDNRRQAGGQRAPRRLRPQPPEGAPP
ncbi:MAG: dihydropteroate synthase [Acidimicrobiales bacterium]